MEKKLYPVSTATLAKLRVLDNFASEDETRAAIMYVIAKRDGLIAATNGHIMGSYSVEDLPDLLPVPDGSYILAEGKDGQNVKGLLEHPEVPEFPVNGWEHLKKQHAINFKGSFGRDGSTLRAEFLYKLAAMGILINPALLDDMGLTDEEVDVGCDGPVEMVTIYFRYSRLKVVVMPFKLENPIGKSFTAKMGAAVGRAVAEAIIPADFLDREAVLLRAGAVGAEAAVKPESWR